MKSKKTKLKRTLIEKFKVMRNNLWFTKNFIMFFFLILFFLVDGIFVNTLLIVSSYFTNMNKNKKIKKKEKKAANKNRLPMKWRRKLGWCYVIRSSIFTAANENLNRVNYHYFILELISANGDLAIVMNKRNSKRPSYIPISLYLYDLAISFLFLKAKEKKKRTIFPSSHSRIW